MSFQVYSGYLWRLCCVAWLGLYCALVVPAAHADGKGTECSIREVIALDGQAKGRATLCAGAYTLKGSIRVRKLSPGSAYTVWWAYFDDPSQCAIPYECGLADFGGANPLGVFGRMDSGIAPRRGTIRFRGDWRGMQPSAGSQVWLLVFGHGEADFADGRHLARQLLTPEDPNAGAPHLGNHFDGPLGVPTAVAIFDID